jgi:uncharacterized protein (DUF1800 family)
LENIMPASAIALNRFGLGARPNDSISGDAKTYLINQLAAYQAMPAALIGLPSRSELAAKWSAYLVDRRDAKQNMPEENSEADMMGKPKKDKDGPSGGAIIRPVLMQAATARVNAALESETGFAERIVHFWSNHFAISTNKQQVTLLAGNYEFDAIRPNIMGKFSQLLWAAVRHPAMLFYLDQAQSIGPNSQFAQRPQKQEKKIGLNENLAREIMELHTLGVRSGYTQKDVTEFARAMTGITVAGMGRAAPQRLMDRYNAVPGDTLFLDGLHEPGSRTVMGKVYAQNGEAQAREIIANLCAHPMTARHIATKLARHFTTDNPPASLVAKLEANFLKSGGDLPSLYRTLIEAPEAWQETPTKFKSPWDWTISAYRALNIKSLPPRPPAVALFKQLGQPLWDPGSPAGFADTAETWAGSAALLQRVEFAAQLAERVQGGANKQDDARALAKYTISGPLSALTSETIANAESPAQGLALLLVSPEFLRR